MQYALGIWSLSQKRDVQRIHSVITAPLRLTLGLHRSVNRLALLADFGMPTFPLLLRSSMVALYHRLCALPPSHPSHIHVPLFLSWLFYPSILHVAPRRSSSSIF